MAKKEVNKQSVKTTTAWAVETHGKVEPFDVCSSRKDARELRNTIVQLFGKETNAHVRKVQISVIPGR